MLTYTPMAKTRTPVMVDRSFVLGTSFMGAEVVRREPPLLVRLTLIVLALDRPSQESRPWWLRRQRRR